MNIRAYVQAGEVGKNASLLAKARRSSRSGDPCSTTRRPSAAADKRWSKLAGRNPAKRISQTQVEQVDTKLAGQDAIHGGKAHPEQNLRIRRGHTHIHQ